MPLRRCSATGVQKAKNELLRFVVGPDGSLVPDLDEKLPGRGLWLSGERDMVNTACAKGLFSYQAGREVKIPADFAGLVDGLMVRRCLDLIGLARRAGKVVAGFEKVQARLRGRNDNNGHNNNGGDVLLQASDGAGDGRDKIKALAPGIRSVDVFKARELGRAIGRDQAVHVVMAGGKLAESLIREANRLMAFRGPDR